MTKCIKCKKEIPEGSLYCNFCGKKQSASSSKYHKRAHGTGTITKDSRNTRPWVAIAPSTRYGSGRLYLGSYATRREAQIALDAFIKEGRPELFNATLKDVYELWSDVHYKRVSDSAVKLYTSMWKRFADIEGMKMRDVRTAHYQELVNAATSKSACDTIKALAVMINRCAMENDIISKNYAEFIKIPKFEKKEKRIFTGEEITRLWENCDDGRVQIILFMIYTGFRIGEMCALTVDSINLDDGYIIGGEKTEAGRDRIVPIPPCIPELKDFVRGWLEQAQGKRLFPMSVSKFREDIFYKGLIYCQIDTEGLSPHSTRHTFASISSAAGMRPENLQRIIGHADFSVTSNVYIHQDLETLLREMGKIKK